jgi:O-acetyl-ADP-ribose deacetylase (regulator of RNase III)
VNDPKVLVGDITTLEVDVIVNAANEQLAPGGGVCGAIHRAAGPGLAEECSRLGPCEPGDARITSGYDLPARRVIHAVGPVYHDGSRGEPEQLASCYQRSLELASEHNLRSIAFPCISTGIFGYPIEQATEIALTVIQDWLGGGRPPAEIVCCCFTESDAEVYRNRIRKHAGP